MDWNELEAAFYADYQEHDELAGLVPAEFAKFQHIPVHGGYPSTSTQTICNRILLPGEQRAIRAAALAAWNGNEEEAERCRAFTLYDQLSTRDDADGNW